MSTNEDKLDIFVLLKSLQNKDFTFYNKLSDQQKKEVVPLLLQRWLSGTSDRMQIIKTNEYVNPYVFSLYKHPELLHKLLVCAAEPNSGRLTYPKILKKNTNTPICIEVLKRHFNISKMEAHKMIDTIEPQIVLNAAYDLGYSTSDINKLKKELV